MTGRIAARARAPMPRQVICIRWGTRYGLDYVHRLHAMVARNLGDFRFFCVTDDPIGLRDGIEPIALPPLGCDYPPTKRGIWNKARLWRADLGAEVGLGGPVLFMDLDVVVTGRLEPFFAFGGPEDVILARNPSTPFERLGQTSVYRFTVGALQPLHDAFAADPEGTARRYTYEQRYVTRNAPGGVRFWPRAWVRLFRHDCVWPFPLNLALPPRERRDMRIAVFAGRLNPSDAIAGRYDFSLPGGTTLAEHVRTALTHPYYKGRRLTGLRRRLLPSPWVAQAWRDD